MSETTHAGEGPLDDVAKGESKANGKAKAKANGKEKAKRSGVTGEGIVAQLKDDVCRAIDQVGLSFVQALEGSHGREAGGITITCDYKPGGEKSNKRFIVRPALGIKGRAIERPADMVGDQLTLYDE